MTTSTQGQKKFNLGATVWKPAEWFFKIFYKIKKEKGRDRSHAFSCHTKNLYT